MARATKRKVFCIGFHKTGTTTMKRALEILGYRVTGPNDTRDPDIGAKLDGLVERLAQKYDAFQDNPWPLVYRKMDALYPGARFILTVRDEDKWFASNLKHFGTDPSPMRELIYGPGNGFPEGHEALYKERMRQHNREVAEYFAVRPDDLLTIELAKDARWEPLCGFLGAPVPEAPFPHANSVRQRELRQKWGAAGRLAGRFVKPT